MNLVTSILVNRPYFTKELIKENYRNLSRTIANDTLGWQTFSKMTDKQIEKSGRAIEYYYYSGLASTSAKSRNY